MRKWYVFCASVAALLLCCGLAGAASVDINFDTLMSGAGLNPVDEDGNGNGDGDPNGILDSDELAVVSWILADASRTHHDAVHAAYTQNLNRLMQVIPGAFAAAYAPPLAGYMVLGDAGTIARATAILASVGQTLVITEYDVSQTVVLGFDADPDGDGQTNLQEYTAIAGTGGPGSAKRTQYIADIFTAPVTPVNVDFDAAFTAASLNPATTDGNGGAAGTPNGILDTDELAVLSFILADTGNTYFTAAKAAYEQNLAQMNSDLGVYAPLYGVPLAGYMTLGDANTIARATAVLGSVGKTLTLAAYDLSQLAVIAYSADPDNDGLTNLEEYTGISGTGGPGSQKRTDYIAAVFTPYVNPECIDCTPTGGVAAVGSNVCLRVPVSSGNSFQWSFNGQELSDGRVQGSQCQSLRITNVQLEDSGVYRCAYDDGTKAAQTYTLTLTVSASVPAGSPTALVLLTALLASAAALVMMRARRRA